MRGRLKILILSLCMVGAMALSASAEQAPPSTPPGNGEVQKLRQEMQALRQQSEQLHAQLQKIMAEAQPTILDRDTVVVSTPVAMDYRGEPMVLKADHYMRELLRVRRPKGSINVNPIVAVRVTCPSTGHVYLLRVPPETVTCQEAVAWTFGLSSLGYQPTVEA
mgnify:CR=1 FL=1